MRGQLGVLLGLALLACGAPAAQAPGVSFTPNPNEPWKLAAVPATPVSATAVPATRVRIVGEPPSGASAPASESAWQSGGLGLNRAAWEARHGRPGPDRG